MTSETYVPLRKSWKPALRWQRLGFQEMDKEIREFGAKFEQNNNRKFLIIAY